MHSWYQQYIVDNVAIADINNCITDIKMIASAILIFEKPPPFLNYLTDIHQI